MAQFTNQQVKRLATRRGDYGFDAPFWPVSLSVMGVLFTAAGFAFLLILDNRGLGVAGVICFICGLIFLLSAGSYTYTTRRGKHVFWAKILLGMGLKGHERILDVGCGRGAVLLMGASLLSRGKAVGIDLWRKGDQSGNDQSVTQRNAELEGVADRVELFTGDMRELPFSDRTFDVVLSSMAIHNISESAGRDRAVAEMFRVLKPGGRVAIVDFVATAPRYWVRLKELGAEDVIVSRTDWRFWYGSPWAAVRFVGALKPA